MIDGIQAPLVAEAPRAADGPLELEPQREQHEEQEQPQAQVPAAPVAMVVTSSEIVAEVSSAARWKLSKALRSLVPS